jgi:hypothetical protein
MTDLKRAYLYSPVIGAVFAGLSFWLYSLGLIFKELNTIPGKLTILNFISNAISLLPIFLIVSLIVSYLLFYPLHIIIEKIKYKYNLKEGAGWALMFLCGLTIGSSIVILTYNHNIFKTILIILVCSFGLMFNSSLFSVITNKTK